MLINGRFLPFVGCQNPAQIASSRTPAHHPVMRDTTRFRVLPLVRYCPTVPDVLGYPGDQAGWGISTTRRPHNPKTRQDADVRGKCVFPSLGPRATVTNAAMRVWRLKEHARK